jgi:hypothetical protein
MDLANRCETLLAEHRRQASQCRPKAAVDVCDLAGNEATDENIGVGPDLASQPEELLSAPVCPPTSVTMLAKHFISQVGQSWIARGFEDNAVVLDELEGLSWTHGCIKGSTFVSDSEAAS